MFAEISINIYSAPPQVERLFDTLDISDSLVTQAGEGQARSTRKVNIGKPREYGLPGYAVAIATSLATFKEDGRWADDSAQGCVSPCCPFNCLSSAQL